MFIGALQSVADRSGAELTDETRRSLDLALRYFREAAPKHTADEEESLFPRLRRIENPELQACLARLDALEEDHRWAEPLHQTIDQLGSKYLQRGRLAPDEAQTFREMVYRLHSMYQRHIAVEDKEVFPVVDRVLSAEMKSQIAQEMAARRGTKPIVTL